MGDEKKHVGDLGEESRVTPETPEGNEATTKQQSAEKTSTEGGPAAGKEAADRARKVAGQATAAARDHAGKASASMKDAYRKGGVRGVLTNNYFAGFATGVLVLVALWFGAPGCPVPDEVAREAISRVQPEICCNGISAGEFFRPIDYSVRNRYQTKKGEETYQVVDFAVQYGGLGVMEGQTTTQSVTIAFVQRGNSWYSELQ